MNNALPFTSTTRAHNQESFGISTKLSIYLAHIFKSIAALIATRDDPAALRYIASKYNGEGD